MAENNNRRGFFIPKITTSGGSKSLLSGSGVIFLGFIAIAITGAFLLTGGINPLPQNQLTEPEQGTYEIDEESLTQDETGKKNLQLKTIEFKECQNQASATLFVDRSGSMGYGNKLQGLQNALFGFIDQMGDDSVTGLISYSEDVTEDVPINLFSTNEAQMRSAISSLSARGGTRTRNAFSFALDKVLAAKSSFPDKEHVVIFLSDGIPEAATALSQTCTAPACSPNGRRCFETTEDPTNTSIGQDLAQQIKDADIRVFSIALYEAQDACFQDDLKALMQRIASPDSYFETPNPADLENIYKEISTQICKKAE